MLKRIPLPALRLGYHTLRLYWMQEPELERFAESRFIVCPLRAPFRARAHGRRRVEFVRVALVAQLGLRRFHGSASLPSTLSLKPACDFIALNPLHAIPNRQPYNTSPYLPQCSLYRNFIYLDVEKIGCSSDSPRRIEKLRASEFVEYEIVVACEARRITQGVRRFRAGSPEFDRYVEAEGDLAPDLRRLLRAR